GRQIVYVANRQLFLRRLSDLEATPIKGTEPRDEPGGGPATGVNRPVFSPDGLSLAYYAIADRVIKRIPASGGTPTTLCEATNPYGMTWDASGIVFSQNPGGIKRVSADGGRPESLADMHANEVAHDAQILPGGTFVLFTITDTAGVDARVVGQSLMSGQRETLIEDAADARYLPTGHLAFVREGVMFAAPFDVRRLAVTGAAVPVVAGVRRTNNDAAEGQFAMS